MPSQRARHLASWHVVLLGAVACVACCPLGADAADARLRVKAMTFNIRYGTARDGANHWTKRRKLVFGVFRKHQPDLVGVQEALPSQIEELRRALPEYHHVGRTREADPKQGEAAPIFYRHKRWQAKESGTFWLSDTPEAPGSRSWGNWIPRIVTWARLAAKPSGADVLVFNVHLDHRSEPSRQKSIALLADRAHALMRKLPAEPPRVILTGDFNCGESSPAIQYITGRKGNAPVQLVDTFRVLHPDARGSGTFNAWLGVTAGPKIDYVLTLPGAKVLHAAILHDNEGGRFPSDHFPVVAELEF